MITVRFPSGFSVQYNTANFIEGPDEKGTIRIRKEQGDPVLIARVPKECIIELNSPCRTYDASTENTETRQQIDSLRREVRSLARKVGKLAK